MYWERIVQEVLNKDNPDFRFTFTDFNPVNNKAKPSDLNPLLKRKNVKRYLLGDQYPGVYLTVREAHCMYHLIKGKTVMQIAATLKLSHRTVEYYINNMKQKLLCKTRSELIDKIYVTDFLLNIDFE